ncbi:MAG TPA: DNA repair protein RecO [Rhodospirillaceae bacterium]|jgi:DNA repair protein RecO (recombination protein O)|nr:DNA repair protein RecO [Alphaproteobacteria bacterium]HBH26869.1 DNA repair protein RecO [Rhodospirillaceae bacterium]
MEAWEDQAIILSARPYGEGAVAHVLTAHRGKRAGYVYGSRAALEPGTLAAARWQARGAEFLGTLSLEPLKAHAPLLGHDAARLAALASACALLDAGLAEREPAPGAFEGLCALLSIISREESVDPWLLWPAAYVFWEVQLLDALGFALDLEACAAGGDGPLTHVSPRTGRAVSAQQAEPYEAKLLKLPGFLRPERAAPAPEDILGGLALTGYFLEHRAFAQDTRGLPAARARLLAALGGMRTSA